MVNAAIADGTGVVGRTLIEVMASQTKHQAIILTCRAPDVDEKPLGPTYKVDYANIASLTAFLGERNVQTVISILCIAATSLTTSRLNPIVAADRSSATSIEWAAVINGMFLEYFTPPALEVPPSAQHTCARRGAGPLDVAC
ncbi:Oxidoreductase BOA1 [Colletotrichum sidae]|uniref:Oxidoreductase BOA1 n=1 Tax=Colletotrichum sidae TaxID=1347389 RepID=A0A4R8TCV6_9PEZI|nr:Oxidoreductase BOA1 [Colletotrichum sidae]